MGDPKRFDGKFGDASLFFIVMDLNLGQMSPSVPKHVSEKNNALWTSDCELPSQTTAAATRTHCSNSVRQSNPD